MSPMGLSLPSAIPVNTASGLLPTHPAAVAAYLGVVPPHRLVMTSPLPPVLTRSSVSPHVSSSSSPPMLPLAPVGGITSPPPAPSPMGSTDSAVLDFSTKRSSAKAMEESDGEAILNLSKPPTPGTTAEGNCPLDLSCGGRKRNHEESTASSPSLSPQPTRKSSRSSADFKSVVTPWTSPAIASHFPYFAAAVAAATQSLSPKSNTVDNPLWNGKLKMPEKSGPHCNPTDSSKALEKLNELSKLGGEDLFRSTIMSSNNISGSAGRHSAWQSHWLNKGAEQAKDVLKCVWCKQSFPSLAAMTTHMKETKHCGVNVPSSPLQPQTATPPVQPTVTSPSSNNGPASGKQDLNLLIKETMPLPRKLVRGQDVWLGKGAEQTRQILKCMWCGQSFRSLAEMTSHMQQTQHYTNIISQEQIISWKSADDKQSGGAGGGPPGPGAAGGASSHVSAVLTCKVCDQAFSSLKELSNHMVKNSHYKEHIMRSISESGGRRRQTREKRKKSLPVRKLLELERAQNELKNGDVNINSKITRDFVSGARITCEKCGDKIETSIFVEHIRQCIGGGLVSNNQKNLLKNALLSENAIPANFVTRDGRKSVEDTTIIAKQHRSPSATDISSTPVSPKEAGHESKQTGDSPSVLNAIEKLIEKSFDSRSRHGANFSGGVGSGNAPIGSSILKRLGIDESVDYTKPLVDAQTINILRSYHHQSNYRRERSGSESSSMSERGARSETLTPDRKSEIPLLPTAQRGTPDKRILSPPSGKTSNHEESNDDEPLAKKEPAAAEELEDVEERIKQDVIIKKEKTEGKDKEEEKNVNGQRSEPEEEGRRSANVSHSPVTSPKNESGVNAASPSRSSPTASERSTTPQVTEKKSSLGALSSMFDSLSGGSASNSGEASAASGKTTSSHPLAALQKLCDKTETHTSGSNKTNAGGPPSSGSGIQAPGTAPGAILAFSWACNDAVVTSDSIMKCAFCDTQFISKGAYRHHLSKMHFVKDGVIPDTVALKVQTSSGKGAPASRTVTSPNSVPSNAKSPGPTFEESPHSKFLKYTELAKQLSSKYV